MGFDINLENERGEVLATVSDPQNLLHRLLERSIAIEPLLAEIDWYGDTVFNCLQIPRFLSHWQTLASQIQNPNELRIVEDVKELAVRCEGSVHLYLRELLMLGFDLSERTISRWMKRAPRDPAEPSAGEPSFEPSGSDCGHGFLYCANDYVRRALRFFII